MRRCNVPLGPNRSHTTNRRHKNAIFPDFFLFSCGMRIDRTCWSICDCIDFLVAICAAEAGTRVHAASNHAFRHRDAMGILKSTTDGRFDPMIFVRARDRTEEQACPRRLPWYCRYASRECLHGEARYTGSNPAGRIQVRRLHLPV